MAKKKRKNRPPQKPSEPVEAKVEVVPEGKEETEKPVEERPEEKVQTMTPKSEPKPEPKPEPKEVTKELDPVIKAVKKDAKGKEDKTGKASRLRLAPSSTPVLEVFVGKDVKPYKLSQTAASQVNSYLKIPSDFVSRLSPNLKAEVYDWLFSILPKDEKWTLKTKGHFIRGIIFPGKVSFTDLYILNLFRSILPEKVILDWATIADSYLQFRVILPDCPQLLGNEEQKKPGGLFQAIHVTTSELGLHALKVDFCIWREKGSVAIIPTVKKKRFFRAAAKSEADLRTELSKNLFPIEESISGFAEASTEMMRKARKKSLDQKSASAWLNKMRVKYKFPIAIAEKAMKHFENEEKNLFGLIWAMATVASKISDKEKRYELECLIGLLLELA